MGCTEAVLAMGVPELDWEMYRGLTEAVPGLCQGCFEGFIGAVLYRDVPELHWFPVPGLYYNDS